MVKSITMNLQPENKAATQTLTVFPRKLYLTNRNKSGIVYSKCSVVFEPADYAPKS